MELQIGKLLFALHLVWRLALGGDIFNELARRSAALWRPVQLALVAVVALAICLLTAPHRYNLGTLSFAVAIDRQVAAYRNGNFRRWPIYVVPDEEALYGWIRANKELGDLVMRDSGLLHVMRVAGQRSPVVDSFNVLFSDPGMTALLERIDALVAYCLQTDLPSWRRSPMHRGASYWRAALR